MRAFFADGVDGLHIPWAVEGLPTLLHLSLFLFFSGLVIFLFNVNHTVFGWAIWWIGLFLAVYGWITVMPIFRHDSPYYSPLSGSAWLLYAGMRYAIFRALWIFVKTGNTETRSRFDSLRNWYRGRILGGVEKAAEEAASEQSPVIYLRIMDWTLSALGEDDLLEKFFDVIPGFFKSSMVKNLDGNLPDALRRRFREVLDGFLDRTLPSNSVFDPLQSRRLVICMNAAVVIPDFQLVTYVLSRIPFSFFECVPQSIETGHALARWCAKNDPSIADNVRRIVASILVGAQQRDDRWITLAEHQFGLPNHVLRDNITHGDNSVLLSILIHMTRQVIRSGSWTWGLLSALSKFNIRNTLPGLQREFCALWNEVIQEAWIKGDYSDAVDVLCEIRHLHIALHRGDCAVPTASSASTDNTLRQPSSYSMCDAVSHRPDSTVHGPTVLSHDTLGRSPDVPSHPTPSETLPLLATSSDTAAIVPAMHDTVGAPSASDIYRSTSDGAPALPKGKRREMLPPSIVFGSPSMGTPIPPLTGGVIPAMPPSPIGSAVTRTDFTAHPLGTQSSSPTSLITTRPFAPLPFTTDLEQYPTQIMGTAGVHSDTEDLSPPTPMRVVRQPP